jgi:hypothetical protein
MYCEFVMEHPGSNQGFIAGTGDRDGYLKSSAVLFKKRVESLQEQAFEAGLRIRKSSFHAENSLHIDSICAEIETPGKVYSGAWHREKAAREMGHTIL